MLKIIGRHRVKQIVELVYTTIREPISTFNLPLPVARLLAVPREKLFKMVGAPPEHASFSLRTVCKSSLQLSNPSSAAYLLIDCC